MAPEILGSIISAAGTAAAGVSSAVVSGKMNRRASKEAAKQRAWNEQMTDKQNAWSLDMWNKSNEYNSPSAERQRLIEAGINPLTQDMTDGQASQLTSADVDSYMQPSYQNPIAQGIQTMMQAKQAVNIDADTEQKYAETARLKGITPFEVKQAEETYHKLAVEVENLKKTGNLTDNQIELLNIELKFAEKTREAELNKVIADTAVQNALASLSDKQREEVQYRLEHILPKESDLKEWDIKKVQEDINYLRKQIGIADKDLEYYIVNHSSEDLKTVTGIVAGVARGLKKQGEDSGLANVVYGLAEALGVDLSDVEPTRRERARNSRNANAPKDGTTYEQMQELMQSGQ